jgi:cyclopropane fatty-acyl-phospholipid synthase-like methyltransferase
MKEKSQNARADLWRDQSNRYYESLIERRGEGWQAFWGSPESQSVRFDVFLSHLSLGGSSLLDVGCGFGDFWAYAREKNVHFSRYLGIDFNDRVLEAARRRHQGAEFALMNILKEDPPFRPDYIVASGIMAVNLDRYHEYMLHIFKRFRDLCGAAFALNFLSTCSDYNDSVSRYNEPWFVLKHFQESIDWRCTLVHGYRSHDFTLIHFKG